MGGREGADGGFKGGCEELWDAWLRGYFELLADVKNRLGCHLHLGRAEESDS